MCKLKRNLSKNENQFFHYANHADLSFRKNKQCSFLTRSKNFSVHRARRGLRSVGSTEGKQIWFDTRSDIFTYTTCAATPLQQRIFNSRDSKKLSFEQTLFEQHRNVLFVIDPKQQHEQSERFRV